MGTLGWDVGVSFSEYPLEAGFIYLFAEFREMIGETLRVHV